MDFSETDLLSEVVFKASRSGGSGGQHVNKVSSKVEGRFDIMASALFSPEEKNRLISSLASRLSADQSLRIVSQESRSQLDNKHTVIRKLYSTLNNALKVQKPRKATRPGKAAVEKRLKEKQRLAQKKITRKKFFD